MKLSQIEIVQILQKFREVEEFGDKFLNEERAESSDQIFGLKKSGHSVYYLDVVEVFVERFPSLGDGMKLSIRNVESKNIQMLTFRFQYFFWPFGTFYGSSVLLLLSFSNYLPSALKLDVQRRERLHPDQIVQDHGRVGVMSAVMELFNHSSRVVEILVSRQDFVHVFDILNTFSTTEKEWFNVGKTTRTSRTM